MAMTFITELKKTFVLIAVLFFSLVIRNEDEITSPTDPSDTRFE